MATSAKLWSCVLVAIGAAALPAQQPLPVPTDHYGPPACSTGAKPPVKSDALDRARGERKDALTDAHIVLSDEPLPNFGVERYKLIEYGECTGDNGCYWKDLDAQYKRAEAELKKEIATNKPGGVPPGQLAGRAAEKLAVVMDIDDTTLSSWCEMRREDFGYLSSIYRPWELGGTAVAIPGALRFFNEAREAGVAIFFISGRPGRQDPRQQHSDKDETQTTEKNLKAAGFHGWERLTLRTGEENHMATIAYKSQERRRITADGYRIIMSLGDQWSDLLGDPQADVSVKLPNPFYFIP